MRILFGLFMVMVEAKTVAANQLSSNMQRYLQMPNNVDTIKEVFQNGCFYGRLRLNSFFSDKGQKHYVIGEGGSLIFKSAFFDRVGFTAALYTTQNIWHMDDEYAASYKAGKGVLSRYDVLSNSRYGITSLAQAYLQYKNKDFSLKMGRFLFESFLTRSNDTKMIPNCFQGISIAGKLSAKTDYSGAYLTKQKLRDHSTWHHLLAYGDRPNDAYAEYLENDDPAMHQGLRLSRLQKAGIEDRLIVIESQSREIENLFVRLNYTAVPNLISSATIDLAYGFGFDKIKIAPACRYMRQFDDGAGSIAGANLKNNTVGYRYPESLDSTLWGMKVDIRDDIWKVRLGFTEVLDRGDIIAPWRGFPTAGFTRAMAQYNWYANTKTTMLRIDYDFAKAGLISNLKIFMRFAIQDFDDDKAGVIADNNVATLDILKEFDTFENLFLKMRLAHVEGDKETFAKDGMLKADPSYDEFRLEINYLF